MTVKELIERLKEIDQNKQVTFYGGKCLITATGIAEDNDRVEII